MRGGRDRRHVGFKKRMPEEVNELTPASRVMPSTSGSVATDLGSGKIRGHTWPQCRTSRKAIRKLGRLGRSQVPDGAESQTPQRSVEDALLECLHAAALGSTDRSDEVPITEGDCTQDAITSASSTLIREVGREIGTGSSARKRPAERPAIGSVRRCRSRRIVRQRLRRLYHTDRARLASLVLDGQTGLTCPVPLSEITAVFEGRWGDVRSFRGLGAFGGLGRADNSVFCYLITPLEVMKHLRAIKGSSSPGPDGITKSLLLGWDPKGEKLAHMFSTWLVSGTLPRVFKKCQTVLIPKTSDPSRLGDVNQWRPITIGSMVLRLFSRILTDRMTAACPIHPRQRGFIASPGCSENLSVLEGVMKLSQQERSSLGVVFVDFAKAFDTVSHEHLLSALERKGLDQHMLELVRNSYENCVTKVRCAEGCTADIAMKVGVKQGDPMLPLLFNIALDPLVQTLEREGHGFVANGKSISALAFADDLVLLSGSWEGMVVNLDILETFCELTGMRVQPKAQRYGWSVMREVRWTCPSGSCLAPDLVFTKGDLALVVDVTVRYEFHEDTLEAARLEKVTKYRPLVPVLIRELSEVQRVQVIGFPVGARGKWPSTNETFLNTLGLQRARRQRFAKLVSRRTLLYSLDVLREFMD
ncbi:hypothetical protein ABVT39_021577 [Epinephelus coioides]